MGGLFYPQVSPPGFALAVGFTANADSYAIELFNPHPSHVPDPPRSAVDNYYAYAAFAMLTIAFMHCRNVFLVDNVPDAKLQKARARRGKPPLVTYKTLVVNPNLTQTRREGPSMATGIELAHHICRGHFATYTEERPLFGRPGLHGRFWVPMHVKGKRENGEVVKDYRIELEEATCRK